MFIQKMTSWAVTFSPFDHLYGFIVSVAVLPPFVYFGTLESDSEGLRFGVAPWPNQRSGRYSRFMKPWKLVVLKYCRDANGKM